MMMEGSPDDFDIRSLMRDVFELREALRNVSAETKIMLLEPSKVHSLLEPSKVHSKVDHDTKRMASKAPWARSKTARSPYVVKKAWEAVEPESSIEPRPKQSRGITMGTKFNSKAIADSVSPGPGEYDSTKALNHTRKRNACFGMSKAPRLITEKDLNQNLPNTKLRRMSEQNETEGEVPSDLENDIGAKIEVDSSGDSDGGMEIQGKEVQYPPTAIAESKHVLPSSKAYSFGKAVRTEHAAKPMGSELSTLHVETAEKWVKPRTASVVMRMPKAPPPPPPPPPPHTRNRSPVAEQLTTNLNQLKNGDSVDTMDADAEVKAGGKVVDEDEGEAKGARRGSGGRQGPPHGDPSAVQHPHHASLEVLSHRIKSPSVTFRKDSQMTEQQMRLRLQRQKPLPGPGSYDVATAGATVTATTSALHHKPSAPPVGKIYHTKSTLAANAVLALAQKKSAAQSPGPGAYDVAQADKVVKSVTPAAVNMISSEAKATPHLERKRYWEDKARDAREAHDNMTLADDSMVRPRTPAPVISRPHTGEGKKAIEKRDAVEARLRLQAIGPDEAEDEPRAPDAMYAAVERRPQVRVSMAAEAEARKSSQDRIASKVGVQRAISEKAQGEKAREKFYGPQLPVPWVPEERGGGGGSGGGGGGLVRSSSRGKRRGEEGGNEEEEEMDPIEEVLQLLRARRGEGIAEGAHTTADARATAAEEAASAAAFLRSSLGGGALKVPTAIMRKPRPHERRDAALGPGSDINKDLAFIGPQLPLDWVAEEYSRAQRHKSPAMRIDLNTGRDVIKIPQKGFKYVDEFTDGTVHKVDDIGPGKYDIDSGMRIGENAKGFVEFEKGVAREDVIGPNGERPQWTDVPLAHAIDDEYYHDHQLDIDYGIAKDAAKQYKDQGIELYKQDRHKEEKSTLEPGQHQLGGEWFQGLAGEVEKQWPVVNMKKMPGRYALDDGAEDLMSVVDAPEELDLEVVDWKPHMPRVIAHAFPDKDIYPRFEETPQETGEPRKDPVYTLIDKKEVVLVQMDRQVGRDHGKEAAIGRHEHSEIMDEALGGVDQALAIALAKERAERVRDGIDLTSKFVRAPTVDMSKGREKEFYEPPLREAPDPNDPDDAPHPQHMGIGVDRVPGKVRWAKGMGRFENADASIVDILIAREENIVDPQVEATSRFGAIKGGPTFDQQKKLPRFAPDDPINDLSYEPVDLGKVKKGFGPAPSANMGSRAAAVTTRQETAFVAEEVGARAEVDVWVDDSALQRRVRGGAQAQAGILSQQVQDAVMESVVGPSERVLPAVGSPKAVMMAETVGRRPPPSHHVPSATASASLSTAGEISRATRSPPRTPLQRKAERRAMPSDLDLRSGLTESAQSRGLVASPQSDAKTATYNAHAQVKGSLKGEKESANGSDDENQRRPADRINHILDLLHGDIASTAAPKDDQKERQHLSHQLVASPRAGDRLSPIDEGTLRPPLDSKASNTNQRSTQSRSSSGTTVVRGHEGARANASKEEGAVDPSAPTPPSLRAPAVGGIKPSLAPEAFPVADDNGLAALEEKLAKLLNDV